MYIIANKARWAAWEGICMKKVFIDGSAGTTGLRIFDRLHGRTDIQLLTLPESERKLESSRKRLLKDRKSTRLNSSHKTESRMPSSA